MRVLVSSHPGLGHLNGLVPIAGVLRDRGHQVLAAGCPSVALRFQEAGVVSEVIVPEPLGSDDPRLIAAVPELVAGNQADRDERSCRLVTVKRRADALLSPLLELATSWRPDLVLRDANEVAAWLVGESLGVPHVSFQVSEYWPAERWQRVAGAELQLLRRAVGIGSSSPADGMYRHLHLSNAPPSLRSKNPGPQCTRFIRPIFDDSASQWDGHFDAPLGFGLLSFGSVYRPELSVISDSLAALRDELPAMVSAGLPTVDTTDDWLVQYSYLPLSGVMPTCGIVICHGGRNTVLTALSFGVPLVCLPIASDHFDVADAVVRAGAGVIADWNSESIVASVRRIMGDHEYRRNAGRIATEIREMPDLSYAAEAIENVINCR